MPETAEWVPVDEPQWVPATNHEDWVPVEETKPRLNPYGPQSTISGGPPVHIASLSETLAEPKEELTNPRITFPRLTVQETDSPTVAIGKEAVNIAASIPEFLSSNAGLMSIVSGGVAPTATAAAFTADTLHSLGQQISQTYKNWDKMTENEQRAAIIDIGGTTILGTLLGHGVTKGIEAKALESIPRGAGVAPTPTPSLTPLTDQALSNIKEPNASSIQQAAEVHGDVRSLAIEGQGQMPAEVSSGGVHSQAQGRLQETPGSTPQTSQAVATLNQDELSIPETKTPVIEPQAQETPNARLAAKFPIQEPYSDKFAVSLQVRGEEFQQGMKDKAIQSLPPEIAGNVEDVKLYKGDRVAPNRVELIFKDKTSAQAAIDYFQGTNKQLENKPLPVTGEAQPSQVAPAGESKTSEAPASVPSVTDKGGLIEGKTQGQDYTEQLLNDLQRVPKNGKYGKIASSEPNATMSATERSLLNRLPNELPLDYVSNALLFSDKLPKMSVPEHSALIKLVKRGALSIDRQGDNYILKKKSLESPTPKVQEPQKAVSEAPISKGPGAAAAGEPGTYSPIQRMADEIRATTDKTSSIDSQIGAMSKLKAVGSDTLQSVKNSMANLVAVKDAIWEKWKGLPEYGDEQKAVGKWFSALQQADHEARQFAKSIIKAVPDKTRREAITNWIQADGDKALLQERADASKGTLKQGYEVAQNLSDHEIEIAKMMRDYYDVQLQNGIESGILKEGLDNYITQVWKKENPITKKLVSDLAFGKLTPNFRYAIKRLFESYFEGEQTGHVPNKDAGFLVANYDQSFNKAIAARAFIKDLHEGKASDGRPLVEISGNGKTIGADEGNPTVVVSPHAKPEELNDYRTIDHPALRGWKWATTTPEGQNVFVKGDMIVHPEVYQKLKNRLSTSAFRQNPISRALLQAQTTIKQTMLSVSGFHQVQETLHALGHRVNPANLPEIDFSDGTTKALAQHGLQLADYSALNDFSEGVSGSGLLGKIPGVGPKLHAYNEWLFQDYIPRLKLQMAKLTLERNMQRYPNLSQDKILELTASEANSAFGELPYKYWGRSPTLQDALRTFVLAPDFLEARSRFVGRALMPHGREQLIALGFLAATQYMTARIVNQMLNNDPHWEEKNAFRIVVGSHAYGLRTIPGDMIHLISDTRGFFYNRMSPMLRTAVTYITGRDEKGVKRDTLQQVEQLAKMPIPISMKPKSGQRLWESFLNSFGVQEQRWDAVQTIQQKADAYKKANGLTDTAHESIYNADEDKFAALRNEIQNGDEARAKSEFDRLSNTIPPRKIIEHFERSLNSPLTGSKKTDREFVDSLDANGKLEYQEAIDLRKARIQMVKSLNK